MNYTTHKHPENPHRYLILDHDTQTAKVVRVQGWWVYVRLTERAESLDGIYLPEKSRDEHTCTYEVIAIGECVNDYRQKEKKHRGVLEFDRNPVLDIKVGDTILIPEKATADSGGYKDFIRRSDISEFEGLVDCGLILAKVS